MTGLFERLDPRTRLLTVIAVIGIIASTPPGELRPLPFYAVVILLLLFTGLASWSWLAWRCLAASPFILLAAGLLACEGGLTPGGVPAGWQPAVSVAFKGYSAALLLAFLTATTALSELLTALRRLHAPHVLNMILGVMYRYTTLLSEEYERMERARDCRTVQPLGRHRYAIFAHQFGSLILRSFDRAERVHAAMLSRGFDGNWPSMRQTHFGTGDAVFVTLIPALALIPRLAMHGGS